MLTVDTITDEQIRELRNTKRTVEHWHLCDSAIRNYSTWDKTARARCVEMLNVRATDRILTADTITDDEINALRETLRRQQEEIIERIRISTMALVSLDPVTRDEARARCVQIITARDPWSRRCPRGTICPHEPSCPGCP